MPQAPRGKHILAFDRFMGKLELGGAGLTVFQVFWAKLAQRELGPRNLGEDIF